MKTFVTLMLVTQLALAPAVAAAEQTTAMPAVEMAAFKQLAGAIPLGSRVKMRTTSGKRLTATLMSVTDEGIVVKRESRVPESAVTVLYSELTQLQRHDRGDGMSIGKALGVGLAAGAGAILTLFAIALSIDD